MLGNYLYKCIHLYKAYNMRIGTNLKKLRTNTTKYSQQDIADMLDLDRKTYVSWENETTDIKSQYIPKLAEIFKVDITDLFAQEKNDSIKIYDNDGYKKMGGGNCY